MGAAYLEFSFLQEVFLLTNNASTMAIRTQPAYSENNTRGSFPRGSATLTPLLHIPWHNA
jgi:hypothetical protein